MTDEIRILTREATAIHAITTTSLRLKAISNKFMPFGSYIRTPKTVKPAMTPTREKIIVSFLREKLNIIPSINENAAN